MSPTLCPTGQTFWLWGTNRRGKCARLWLLMGTPCFWFFKYSPRDCVNRRITAALKGRKDIIIVCLCQDANSTWEENIENFGKSLSSEHSMNNISLKIFTCILVPEYRIVYSRILLGTERVWDQCLSKRRTWEIFVQWVLWNALLPFLLSQA